jgi:hypothetical protein
MATYREIQLRTRVRHGFMPKTCWIAHVLSDHGLTTRQAANRADPHHRIAPCPPEKRHAIEQVCRELGRISN